MDMTTRITLNIKINTIASGKARGVAVYWWTVGLNANSDPVLLRAAERDALENGLVFALTGGAERYQHELKKQYRKLASFALTQATGNDDWWYAAQDRLSGLILLEQGEIGAVRFGAADVPEPPPVGLDYSTLFKGQMKAHDDAWDAPA
jgi:hypothetical protein